ncbi:MAG TPA: BamA/TamA family outer membrane protein [Chitinophagaceae bacterium]|nr:BamA/TamA family outer membrane protein [Chitinophagaceae bacterium]
MKLIYHISFITITIILIASCSNTKHLAPGENLYLGAEVKINSSVKISAKKKKDLKNDLSALARPKPNSKILGIRFKLSVYNLVDTPRKNKGLKYWLKNKIGEPPVIASMSQLTKNAEIFQNRLENRGFFHDTVTLDTIIKNKKLKAVYTAHIGEQYKIRKVTFPQGDDTLSASIRKYSKHSFLKPKRAFNLDVIKNEYTRIDGILKEHGFFYFSPDYLFINIDSTVGDHQVDLHMVIKPVTPLDASKSYRINDVVVYADYRLNSSRQDTSLAKADTAKADGYKIIDPAKRFNPKLFSRVLVFKKDSTYNRTTHNLSLNRLVTLGVFRFVKARFEKADSVRGDYLNAFYYLTPTRKKSIRFTATALSKSNNATGTQLSVNWLNRNLFKGAEQLTISPYVGYEKQISSQQNAATKRLGIDASLTVPRIISPFHFKISSGFVPKTKFQVGYELFKSDTLYTLNSFTFSYGYIWKQKLQSENTLNLANISYVRPTNIQPAFQKEIDSIITLYRSIEPQLIISSSYNFNLNTQAGRSNRKNNYYLNINGEAAGNIIGLLTHANIKKGNEVDIFNVPFSQFVRLEADFRHYLSLSKNTVLASRFWGGIGYTYGNSQFMPFAKAFFAGGTNDIRAFRSRALGPGSYYRRDTANSIFLPEQPGDIKLEASVELRQKLFSIVRGAIFIDAGNIWTLRKDSARSGAEFSGNFLNQIAIGAGFGLRFDLNILVLRLDVAYPIRKPYASYLSSNKPVYNLAIGYPF